MPRDRHGGYTHRGLRLSSNMVEGLDRYIKDHILPGDFLQAVIANDLAQATGRADEDNLKVLPAFVAFLYNEAPSECWGSRQKLRSWLKGKSYWEERNAVWKRFEERYEGSEGDLDGHVHELMSKNASAINNAGLQDQFNYLCDEAGLDWVEEALLHPFDDEDDEDDEDDDDQRDAEATRPG